MSDATMDEFLKRREALNETLTQRSDLLMKRFLRLDTVAYEEGVLEERVKEMLGLVASLVLRCDACVAYHLNRCYEKGLSFEAVREVLGVGLVVGGSITIPHLRRAMALWESMEKRDGGSENETSEP